MAKLQATLCLMIWNSKLYKSHDSTYGSTMDSAARDLAGATHAPILASEPSCFTGMRPVSPHVVMRQVHWPDIPKRMNWEWLCHPLPRLVSKDTDTATCGSHSCSLSISRCAGRWAPTPADPPPPTAWIQAEAGGRWALFLQGAFEERRGNF